MTAIEWSKRRALIYQIDLVAVRDCLRLSCTMPARTYASSDRLNVPAGRQCLIAVKHTANYF